jgi:radical SAM protein with 4Fe4S-binding SPASM domain
VWRDEPVTSGRCAFFGAELAVLSNGAVTFCHIDYDGQTAIGNADEKPLAEIVGAPEVQRMAAAFVAGQEVARGCERCHGVKPVAASSG